MPDLAGREARRLQMLNNKEELAYIAGFFDGEGSITIHDNGLSPRSKFPNHMICVSIGNTDPKVILWVHSIWGGHLDYREGAKANHRRVVQWMLRTAAAVPFLEAIRPFLRMKGPQVDIALAFQRTKTRFGPRNRITSEIIEWREEQRQIIRAMNAKEWIEAR